MSAPFHNLYVKHNNSSLKVISLDILKFELACYGSYGTSRYGRMREGNNYVHESIPWTRLIIDGWWWHTGIVAWGINESSKNYKGVYTVILSTLWQTFTAMSIVFFQYLMKLKSRMCCFFSTCSFNKKQFSSSPSSALSCLSINALYMDSTSMHGLCSFSRSSWSG